MPARDLVPPLFRRDFAASVNLVDRITGPNYDDRFPTVAAGAVYRDATARHDADCRGPCGRRARRRHAVVRDRRVLDVYEPRDRAAPDATIVDVKKLPERVQNAIQHAHDAEDYP